MLDHDDSVAPVAQTLERSYKALVVARMQAYRRLVQDIQHAGKSAADLCRETDPLHLAARKRRGGSVEREIVETDIEQESQPADNLLHDLVHPRKARRRFKKGKRVTYRHGHHLDDGLASDGGRARLGTQTRAFAVGTRLEVLVGLPLLAGLVVLGLLKTTLQCREHSLERTILPAPRQDEVVLEAVHEVVAEFRRQLLVGCLKIDAILLRYLLQKRVVVHYGVVACPAPGMDALPERQRPVRHDKLFVEIVQLPKPRTSRTSAERRVEGERPRLQFVERYAAVDAGVELRVRCLVDVHDARALLERKLYGIRQAGSVARQHKAVDDDVDVVRLLLVQLWQLVHRMHDAVDPDPCEAVAPDGGERFLVSALLALHYRGVDDDPPLALHYGVNDLFGRLAANLPAASGTVGRRHGTVKYPQVVMYLGDGRDY